MTCSRARWNCGCASCRSLPNLGVTYARSCTRLSTRQELVRASAAAGIGHIGTPAFRHTHRSWLDQAGTQLAVQQKAMRPTDLRTTIAYGDVMDNRIEQALEKVADLAFSVDST